MLTSEQIKELKSQLKSQISHLPYDKRAEAEKQIDEMSPESLELMLKQQQSSEQKIFRMIVSGKIPSVIVAQNEKAISVLSTKSISKGHCIIIPKSPVNSPEKIPKEAFLLAQELSKKIIDCLKAKETRAETETAFGESIINLIPIYDSPLNLDSPRHEKTLEQLEEIKKELEVIRLNKEIEKIKIKKPRKTRAKVLKLNRRVP